MERQRVWNRILSRLHRNHARYSCEDADQNTGRPRRQRIRRHNSTSNAPRVQYSRLVRDVVRRPQVRENENNFMHFLSNGVWHNLFRSDFNNSGAANRRNSYNYTPKCLTGIDCCSLLTGQGTVDDFSRNCWLENHLHRFGGIQTNDSGNVVMDSILDESVPFSASNSEENQELYPELSGRVGDGCSRLRLNSLSGNTVNMVDSNFSLLFNNFSSSSNLSNTSNSNSTNDTVSDITHFYNNVNLGGFAFDPNAPFPEPPPYSALPDDPPPPYSEVNEVDSGRSASSVDRRASVQLFCEDILW